MYLIVGLGNPETEYSNTRHNIGFDVVNEISNTSGIIVNRSKFESLYGQGIIEDEKVILLKPQMYMNLSGIPIKKFIDFYKIEKNKIIVIHDDIDVENGKIKIRKIGGSGTHNGMKSVLSEIGNKDFYRVKIGVGNPPENIKLMDFILQKIDKEERKILDKAVVTAKDAIYEILKNGIDVAMNKFN